MKSKLFKIVETVFILVLSGIGFLYFYNKLVEIHSSSCCTDIDNCPLYLCSSNSPDLTRYSIYATVVVFCAILFILFIVNLIRILLKEEK